MTLRSTTPIALATAAALLAGCATTAGQETLVQRTAQAIGRSVGQFTISDRTDETSGRINFLVNTRDGAAYSCYLIGATGFQKAMTIGQIPHSDAICTAKVGGQARGVNPSPAAASQPGGRAGEACNALLRAAGRC